MDNELKVPNHIAIILDGNGRWAKKRNMPRGYGHIVGCDNLEKMCDVIKDMGVKYLHLGAYSTVTLFNVKLNVTSACPIYLYAYPASNKLM